MDTSGVPTPVGTPHTSLNDSFPTDWKDTHRLAIWGNPKSSKVSFIRGRLDSNSVPNESWLFLDEKTSIRLSEFSISRITKSKQLRKIRTPIVRSEMEVTPRPHRLQQSVGLGRHLSDLSEERETLAPSSTQKAPL